MKKERYNPETERFEAVEREPLFGRRNGGEVKELTREEQVEPKRVHPWQTERGKRFIGDIKSGVKRLDRGVVNYNRTRNPMRGRSVSQPRGGRNDFNPFGNMFDSGVTPMRRSKSRKSKSKAKYVVVGGKAYPKAGSGKKRKKKQSRKRNDPFGFDIGFSKGW